jgi:hypothetical protein
VQEYLQKVSQEKLKLLLCVLWCLSFPKERPEIKGLDKEKDAGEIASLVVEALKCR